jgi:hypothetical protein
VALPPCPGRVHRWSLSRSLAVSSTFPCNTPGRVHRRSLFRSPVTLLPSPQAPHPAYTCGTPVARCFTGLSLPHPPLGPYRAGPRGNTKPGAAHFGTLFLSVTSIRRNPKPPSQTNPITDKRTMRLTNNAAHFGTSFLSVSFVGLSSRGLQNRPCRDCLCQFLSLGCHLGGCRIGLVETVSVSFFRWVVIWGLQNRPCRDYFCQFLSLGCHLGGCRIGLVETISVSFFRWVVI